MWGDGAKETKGNRQRKRRDIEKETLEKRQTETDTGKETDGNRQGGRDIGGDSEQEK
jgi:hypothetical protein